MGARGALTVVSLSLLLAASPVSARAERLLLEGPEVRVSLDREEACGQPLAITVESARAELFEPDSVALQRVVDGARAVLAYECERLPELRVQGRLKGLSEPVYRAVATSADAWLLAADRVLREAPLTAPPAGPPAVPGAAGPAAAGPADGAVFSVAGLKLGMTLEAARRAALESFGVAPRYDSREGLLRLEARGCPADHDWSRRGPAPTPGWKCLRGWFTDQREPVLYRLELVQVIHAREAEAAERALEERYGAPAFRRMDLPFGAAPGGRNARTTRLGWGPLVPSTGTAGGPVAAPEYTLTAILEPRGDALVTSVKLLQPTPAAPAPASRPDLTL